MNSDTITGKPLTLTRVRSNDGMDSSRVLFGIMVPAEALGGFSINDRRSPR